MNINDVKDEIYNYFIKNTINETALLLTDYQFNAIVYFSLHKTLRLNATGFKMLNDINPLHKIDRPTENGITPSKHYVYLTRFCSKPYYINKDALYFMDEEEAFLFKLCDGDIDNVKDVVPENIKNENKN